MDTTQKITEMQQQLDRIEQMLSVFVAPPKQENAQEGMGAYELSRIVSSNDPLEAIRERNKRVKARRK